MSKGEKDMEKISLDDLENVTGGAGVQAKGGTRPVIRTASQPVIRVAKAGTQPVTQAAAQPASQTMMMECPECHFIFPADVMQSSIKCPNCPHVIEIKG